jgi:hypothetical protein
MARLELTRNDRRPVPPLCGKCSWIMLFIIYGFLR